MVDWKDPKVVAFNFFLYEQIAVFLLGFYGTQFVNSWNVEWQLITRKRAFRVVHVPYLLARYITLVALLFFVISGRVKSRLACDAAYRTFASLGSLAGALASLILCSRPVAICWTLKRRIPLALLALLALGQMILVILQGVISVRAQWNPGTSSCVVSRWDNTMLALFYLYTFIYDVIILLVTLYAVREVRREQGHAQWNVGDVLCIQGLGYVVVTCLVNVPVSVLAFLDLNAGMDVLLSLPAMAISVIASSLTLIALGEFGSKPKPAAPAPADGTGSTVEDSTGYFEGTIFTHIPMELSAIDSEAEEVLDDRLADKTEPEPSVGVGARMYV